MKIQSKFFVWSIGLIVVVAMFGLFSVTTLVGLWRSARSSAAEYAAMDHAGAAAKQLAWYGGALRQADGRTYVDVKYLAPIRAEIDQLLEHTRLFHESDEGDAARERQLAESGA